MTVIPSQIAVDRTLALVLGERGTFPAAAALALVRSLALQVAELHDTGMIHGAIDPGSVALNDRDVPRLEMPPAGTVLELSSDWSDLLPELSRSPPLNLPATIEAAAKRFQGAGIALDPRQIDLCQLGALWCRLVTGESAGAYLRSPRVKGLVPAEVRPLLERILGTSGRERFADVREFAVALQAVAEQFGPPATMSGAEEPPRATDSVPARTTSDTTPSFVLSGDQSADTSIAPGQPSITRKETVPSPREEEPLPFARLGHYEIVRQIGHGGMGDVYLGYEQALDRKVAIKVLPADLARSDDFVRRFRTEATAVAKLNHPNIVPIHLIGEDQGHHFYVMQFVEGESLAERLGREERLGVVETLKIVEQALAGLAAAHDQGMVHRDIKPGNILLDSRSGRALLADFGLVKSLDSSVAGKTATGIVMGTADYISPEQGRGRAVDHRSDLYSVGVLLYRMLSGRLPFTADSPTALIFQHVYEPPPDLQSVVPDVPAALAQMVARLLAKSPADRHQTAEGVLADLRVIRAGEPLPRFPSRSPAGSPTTIIRLPKFDEDSLPPANLAAAQPPDWWKEARHRALSMFRRNAPEVLLQLQNTQQQLDGAVAVYERRQPELQDLADAAESVLVELKTQAQAQRSAASAARRRAASALEPTEQQRALDELTACERAADELERQSADQQEQLGSIRLRLAQARARVQELQNQRGILNARLKTAKSARQVMAGAPQRSTDRPRKLALRVALVMLAGTGTFWIVRSVVSPAPDSPSPSKPVAPNDASQVPKPADASAGDSSRRNGETKEQPAVEGANDVELATPVRRFVGHQKPTRTVAISPEGSMFASGSDDGTVRVWNPETAGGIKSFDAHTSGVNAVAFGPQGEWLVTGGRTDARDRRTLKIWDPAEGREIRTLVGRAENVSAIAVSPDARTVAALYADGLPIAMWDVIAGREERTIDPGIRPIAIAFSPDGSHLALAGNDREVRLWSRVQNEVALILKGHERSVTAVAYSGDGSRLYSGDEGGTLIQWDLKSARADFRLQSASGGVTAISPNSNGRRLAVIAGTTAEVWDLDVRHVRKALPDFSATSTAYLPDARTLIAAGADGSLVLWDGGLKALHVSQHSAQIEVAPAGSRLHTAFTTLRSPPRVLIGGPQCFGVWDFEARAPFRQLETIAETITAVTVSPEGQLAATADDRGWLGMWRTGSELALLRRTNLLSRSSSVNDPRRTGPIRHLVFTPQANAVLVVTADSMFLWDVSSGTESHSFRGVPTDCRSAAISAGGKYVAVGAWDSTEKIHEVRLWDLQTGQQMPRLIGDNVRIDFLMFPPDERRLLAGGKQAIWLWDVSSGPRPMRVFQRPAETGGSSAAIVWTAFTGSPDGRHLISGGTNALSVWDVETGEELLRFGGGDDAHTASVSGVGFSQHETSAVSIGQDGNIRVWPLPLIRFQASQPAADVE
ncbi:MAG TPA: protein kinase [Planctomycetaceae bacterium]|jgi:serine/threonine protein kinase/WD40 repeat protein